MNESRKRSRLILLGIIFSLHCALILGPLGFNALMQHKNKQQPIAFRVKLGGFEPSHAPEVGMPERKRPSAASPAPAPVPAPPKPEPKPKTKPKTKAKPKPKPKSEKKAKAKPKSSRKKTVKKKPAPPAKRTAKKSPSRKKTQTPKPQEVFHDSRWDNFYPNRQTAVSGGSNFNRNVPIGSRDRGQKIGRADHRTPAGGATPDEEKYAHDMVGFIREKWDRPPGILVDETVAVTIELTIDANGRVIGKRIIKPSPNPAVNRSVQELLKKLSIVPRPPNGGTTLAYSLISE